MKDPEKEDSFDVLSPTYTKHAFYKETLKILDPIDGERIPDLLEKLHTAQTNQGDRGNIIPAILFTFLNEDLTPVTEMVVDPKDNKKKVLKPIVPVYVKKGTSQMQYVLPEYGSNPGKCFIALLTQPNGERSYPRLIRFETDGKKWKVAEENVMTPQPLALKALNAFVLDGKVVVITNKKILVYPNAFNLSEEPVETGFETLIKDSKAIPFFVDASVALENNDAENFHFWLACLGRYNMIKETEPTSFEWTVGNPSWG